ncbi:MAG: ABC transporter ATP-binding protein [Planctomyces sp.]|nr:ABC transporter ATP-binding protein [Planctomyces sp.]
MSSDEPAEQRILYDLDSVYLGNQQNSRLKSVTLTIRSGVTAVVGMSGAGKTSLLNLLSGFEHPDSGTIRRGGEFNRAGGGRLPMFWVPSGGGLWPHMTAGEHLINVHPDREFAVRAGFADKILKAFDLTHRTGAYPAELSQGERSRLSLARAIVTGAEILILDEPLSHVDTIRQPKYWQILREAVEEQGVSMIFSSHEPETILRESSHVICLDSGQVVWFGSTGALYHQPSSREAAMFLGPVNWVGGDQEKDSLPAAWIQGSDLERVTGLRPESIEAEGDERSALKVVVSVHRGWMSETQVVDTLVGRTGVILHLTTGEHLRSGQGVRFVVRSSTKRGC